MNLSAPFIARPVATLLLVLGLILVGSVSYFLLPVSPLPQVDFPTIVVMANQPGASPEIMATSVATPLERHLGQIADVSEMTSSSSQGSTRVTLQFGLNRNINGAARDVQAAINAARADLPTSLRSNPSYRKMNPADAPIIILALTSDSMTRGQIYDAASTILAQKLSQVDGVGQASVGGGSLPAVRVEINPQALFKYGIGLEDVRASLAATNANMPKGSLEIGDKRYQIYVNDQAKTAEEYQSLIIAYRNNAAVRLSDVAEVVDSVEDIRNQGIYNGQPAVLVIVSRQPGANIIETVDRVRALLPQLKASLPAAVNMTVAMDPTNTIRASLSEVERTLLITVFLVIFIVYLFLRDVRSTLIPCVAVPTSLVGTFAVMYLLDYSLDNLSLMALVISTGFVVDDAIVVLENVTRHLEAGMPRMKAALQGAKEVSFTVISMSLSLIAVFIPILLMGGIVGRLFREFAVTLSVSILVSLMISLTATPMMCAYLLRPSKENKVSQGWLLNLSERTFDKALSLYKQSLGWALRHSRFIAFILLSTIGLNVYLFSIVPKGFFPQQDTGKMMGNVMADQSISFQLMRKKMTDFAAIVKADPGVESVVAFTGGSATNSGFMFTALKPISERKVSSDAIIARLRPQLAKIPGASLFLQSVQDIRMGGRSANAQYQYTLQSENLSDLRTWTPKIVEALRQSPSIADVNSDLQEGGRETDLLIDREKAAKLGIKMSTIDNTLYDAFGQRQVSTIYNSLNQYHVVMELAPRFSQNPDSLDEIYISTPSTVLSSSDQARNLRLNQLANIGKSAASSGSAISMTPNVMIPLSAFSSYSQGQAPLAVNHHGHFAATTLSFNLRDNKSLSDAVKIINQTMRKIGVPSTVHASFQGTAKLYQQSMSSMPLLILAAIFAVYIVLGVLYESLIHPLTILSTLPSAGVGAVLALLMFDVEFTIIAMIGVILLIGIVKKNAIMMIDFAINAERTDGLDSRTAITEACLLRFRPIMMTTMAALFGALPLAIGFSEGSEMRRPLGLSIVGGLIFSQILTLYTTPVMYLYLDRCSLWFKNRKSRVIK